MVEHAAVNRGVVGSSPTGGAIGEPLLKSGGSLLFSIMRENKLGPLAQLVRADGS